MAFDNSIEMLMYTCLEYLLVKIRARKHFEDLVDLVSRALDKEKEQAAKEVLSPIEIKNLHRARNAVQHEGNLPSRGDVERYRLVTEAVLRNVCTQIFSIEFSDVSLAQLVKNQAVKTEYLKADEAFSAGTYMDSIIFCTCAFDAAMRLEQGRLYGRFLLHPTAETEEGKRLLEYVDELNEEIEVLKLRLDYKAYQKFREILVFQVGISQPFTSIEDFGVMESELRSRISSSFASLQETDFRPAARFCLDFTVDSTLRWEALERRTWYELFGEILKRFTATRPKTG